MAVQKRERLLAPRRVPGKFTCLFRAQIWHSANTDRAPSKKGQANELSKGALRALRAQSRQTGDWSDNSRSVSRAVSPEPNQEDFDDSPQTDYAYLQGPGPVLVPDVYTQPQPSWGYQQPMQQTYMPDPPLDSEFPFIVGEMYADGLP